MFLNVEHFNYEIFDHRFCIFVSIIFNMKVWLDFLCISRFLKST
jgi:hypothetical protein